METAFRKALDRVKASDELKNKTADFIRHIDDSGVSGISVRATAKRPFDVKRLVLAACIALVLLALPIGGYGYYMMPTSYLSVDINPSVELGINAFGKVVRVTPYNADGQTILSGLSLLNLDVESAVGRIVKSAAHNGFIKDDGSTLIAVTTETDSTTAAAALEADAKTAAEAAVTSENDTATVVTDRVGFGKHDDAAALGISPGKLNLIEKLQALDPEITLLQYKDATVTEIQKKFVELKKEQNGKDGAVPEVSPSPSTVPSTSATSSAAPSPSKTPPAQNNGGQNQHPNNGNGNSDKPNGNSGQSGGKPGNSSDEKPKHSPGATESAASPSRQPPKDNGNGNSHGNGNGNNGNGNSGKK